MKWIGLQLYQVINKEAYSSLDERMDRHTFQLYMKQVVQQEIISYLILSGQSRQLIV